ncbi:MAG TPA: biopolymer transporter ExbD [Nitrospirae bacterium]|nr:biopolymer transporter ExbD [Nitrospirota bacterium]
MEEKGFDYINVIPLVDVMLVLLTIVLTTSTFIATGVIPIELPRASKGSSDTVKVQTIEIDRQGQVYMNSRPVSLNELEAQLDPLDRDIPVLIKADRSIALQVFVDVLDIIKKAEFRKVTLQTEVRQ